MYSYTAKKLPKKTTEITLKVPAADIKKGRDEAFKKLQSNLEVEGFRKGKAPQTVAEKHLKPEQVYQEMLSMILPKIYDEILHKENLKPIISPKIELVSAKENEDWTIKISLCEKPEIVLGYFKKDIAELKSKHKKDEIWVPGKDKTTPTPADKNAENSKKINEILELLLKNTKIEIADLILDDELNHRLSRLVDDVQKIGLTVDEYLKSKNLTMDTIKAQFKKEIEDTYKLEFLLTEIADHEGIKVEAEELDRIFANIRDLKEKEMARQNSYYYATVLRKQKTIDYLISL